MSLPSFGRHREERAMPHAIRVISDESTDRLLSSSALPLALGTTQLHLGPTNAARSCARPRLAPSRLLPVWNDHPPSLVHSLSLLGWTLQTVLAKLVWSPFVERQSAPPPAPPRARRCFHPFGTPEEKPPIYAGRSERLESRSRLCRHTQVIRTLYERRGQTPTGERR